MNPLTFPEFKEKLMRLDEVTLLELLGLDSEQLVILCEDLIEEQREKLEKELDERE